jgi:chromosome segregation ATPase
MTNSSLQRFDHDGIELIINTETGESFASISGYARMSGKIPSTIFRRLTTMSGLREKGLEQAQIETASGLRTVALIPENLICQWLIKDNHELALKVMQLGVRLFLHTLAGFQVKSGAIETNKQLENQVAKLTAKIDTINFFITQFVDEIFYLKDRIKEIESKNSTLEEQIELMGGY